MPVNSQEKSYAVVGSSSSGTSYSIEYVLVLWPFFTSRGKNREREDSLFYVAPQ